MWEMDLQDELFNAIVAGTKTVEGRPYDKDRTRTGGRDSYWVPPETVSM